MFGNLYQNELPLFGVGSVYGADGIRFLESKSMAFYRMNPDGEFECVETKNCLAEVCVFEVGFSPPFLDPRGRKADGFASGHSDEGERLAGGDKRAFRRVSAAKHFEFAPEARPGELGELAADEEMVTEFRGFPVVDFRARHDGEDFLFRHDAQVHAHECGQPGAAGFDHPQVGDVVDDAAAVRIEKHDFLPRLDHRPLVHGRIFP